MCQLGLRGAWGANTGAESTNGATHNACVGIDSPGGAVDGVRGKVNDTHMFWGALHPGTCKCGDTIHQQGLHLLRVCCLAVPQYGRLSPRTLVGANFSQITKKTGTRCIINGVL